MASINPGQSRYTKDKFVVSIDYDGDFVWRGAGAANKAFSYQITQLEVIGLYAQCSLLCGSLSARCRRGSFRLAPTG